MTVMHNPNTFDTQSCHLSALDKTIILCAGDFARAGGTIKRPDRAIAVIADVKKHCPQAQLIMVGRYDLNLSITGTDTLEEQIKKAHLTLGKDVIFTGLVADVESYYSKASVVLCTSMFEGWAMNLIEAYQHGVPVVSNYFNGLEDHLIDGFNGFIVDQGDTRTMADKILFLFDNPEIHKKMGRQARGHVTKWELPQIYRQWKELIELVISKDKKDLEKILFERYRDFNVSRKQKRHYIKEYNAFRPLRKSLISYAWDNVKIILTALGKEENMLDDIKEKIKSKIKYNKTLLTDKGQQDASGNG
jgi:hypothetical protein